MEKIITIQDLSCMGKCSLTVALPIISALGVECIPLPTAVLSNHTAFHNFTCMDLTKELDRILDVWNQNGDNHPPRLIYSGYLSSKEQMNVVRRVYDRYADEAVLFVDPVMADNGKLYKGFDDTYVQEMRHFIENARFVTPNVTEAAILTGMPYREDGDEDYYRELARRMSELGPGCIILTGYRAEGKIGALIYKAYAERYAVCLNERFEASFHGTGDIFASVCCGALAKGGYTLESATQLAVDFVHDCIADTLADKNARWYGVSFEKTLGKLIS